MCQSPPYRYLFAVFAILVGCDRVIDLSLYGLPSDTAALQMRISYDKGPWSRPRDTPLVDRMNVNFSQSAQSVSIMLDVFGADGCLLAQELGKVDTSGIGPHKLGLSINRQEEPGCRLAIDLSGDGIGSVESVLDGQIRCGAGNKSCVGTFPPGSPSAAEQVVELQAKAGKDSVFGGWQGACQGLSSCRVSVGKQPKPVRIGASFLPTRTCRTQWDNGRICWENPLPQGNLLYASEGISENDIWFAGGRGTILHWNGTTLASFRSGLDQRLRSISAAGPEDVFFVGEQGAALHWDGTAIRPVPAPNMVDLLGVFAWGKPARAIAVGSRGTLLFFDGTRFVPMESPTKQNLEAVWGTSGTNIWAVGDRIILHFDGKSWTPRYPSAWSFQFYNVSGSSSDDVWFVGGTILHLDFGKLLSIPLDAQIEGANLPIFHGVKSFGEKDVWFVSTPGGKRKSSLWNWNGNELRAVSGANDRYLSAIWGTGSSNLWITGGSGSVHRWDGTRLQPMSTGIEQPIFALFGQGQDHVRAVGALGISLFWNGSEFTAEQPVPTESANAIWESPKGDVWIAGGSSSTGSLEYLVTLWHAQAPVMRYQAHTLVRPEAVSVNGLWGSGENDVWAVGDNLIIRWDGRELRDVPFLLSEKLDPNLDHLRARAVWGTLGGEVWVAADIVRNLSVRTSVILRGKKDGLREIWRSPWPISLRALTGTGAEDVWAFGQGGFALHLGQAGLPQIYALGKGNDELHFLGASALSPNDVWVVGTRIPDGQGTILRFDGRKFNAYDPGCSEQLNAVWASSQDHVWFAGDNGTILRYKR